jgi:ABC-type phosphonate transport system ATPase subunit
MTEEITEKAEYNKGVIKTVVQGPYVYERFLVSSEPGTYLEEKAKLEIIGQNRLAGYIYGLIANEDLLDVIKEHDAKVTKLLADLKAMFEAGQITIVQPEQEAANLAVDDPTAKMAEIFS